MEGVKPSVGIPGRKPTCGWWLVGSPAIKLEQIGEAGFNQLLNKNTFTVINTKHLTERFVNFCITNKHRVFLHLNISGMNGSVLEPNIPSVKSTIELLSSLFNKGFPVKQVLIILNPILPNMNSIKAIELFLKLFAQFEISRKYRIRNVRLQLLTYKQNHNANFPPKTANGSTPMSIKNPIIMYRWEVKKNWHFLAYDQRFKDALRQLITQYRGVINLDLSVEYIIGVRELNAFGYNNIWFNPETKQKEKIIYYIDNNKFKPDVNIISGQFKRCPNRCLLCPYRG